MFGQDIERRDMAIAHPPSVFVSSTCYDLAQVRQDLRLFLETQGMTPVLSEFNSFPVNPNLDAIGNCLAGVKDKADIFVLVVGGRYGSRIDNGKSITNLEYFEAKAKGIPRYVFVQKPILTSLSIWQKNRTGDFSSVVDSSQLFDFVESLRDSKENWIFPFESAQDIIETLRKQFAYLFMDALSLRGKMICTDLPESLRDLSGTALSLVIQKPVAWEYRLFSQVLNDELRCFASMKKDLNYGIVLGRAVRLKDITEVVDWVQKKMGEISAFVESTNKLVNVAFVKAAGAPGEEGDAEEIVYVGRRLAGVYRSLLEWTSDFKHTQVDELFVRVLEITSRASRNLITEIEDFSVTFQQRLSEFVRQCESMKEQQHLEITLNVTCPDMSDLDDELHRIAKSLGFDY